MSSNREDSERHEQLVDGGAVVGGWESGRLEGDLAVSVPIQWKDFS